MSFVCGNDEGSELQPNSSNYKTHIFQNAFSSKIRQRVREKEVKNLEPLEHCTCEVFFVIM